MRVPFNCPTCADPEVLPTISAAEERTKRLERSRVLVSMTTEAAAEAQCGAGHRFLAVMADGGHAMLYERALQRLADGLWRDAVLDAYTALDMYLAQVPIRARYEVEPSAAGADAIKRFRTELHDARRLSERAIGSALAAVAVATRKAPPEIPSGLAKIRNAAVHAGVYPESKDAEWVVFEVERLVREFERLFGELPPKDTPYIRAVADADFPRSASLPRITMIGLVLSPYPMPPFSASERLQEYRRGERDNLRM